MFICVYLCLYYYVLVHRESIKSTTEFAVSSPNVDWFSKFFHWYTLRKTCNKLVIKDPTTPDTHHYTILLNTNFQNLYRLQSHSRTWTQTLKRMCLWKMSWYCELVPCQEDQSQIRHSIRPLALCAVIWIIFSPLSWLEQKIRLKQFIAQNSCWMMLSSFVSPIKIYSHWQVHI